jgi:hypothetical protein
LKRIRIALQHTTIVVSEFNTHKLRDTTDLAWPTRHAVTRHVNHRVTDVP